MTEAQQLAYRALQEAMDRRDNGGRSEVESESPVSSGSFGADRRDVYAHVPVR
ncbi:hypothetical protein SAMN05421678_11977 [Actinopolymorpha cephalotaxi]|uniref:Uncharacterized protein n=1 Tax=Actinopolymorpha cephalotaxi TaxID=504797 RepID=A0A1I3AIK0_9ACTN|nr:hypothetical protein [Actinopolymorpha cephalotaxi]NYH82167.1 hypothetical protein [Actinopolymorpha cephalotaxi]SFH49696.1 hypothetical protein SAMN05421678_11977 [Actinopolymorpha cephalotaxi]